MAVLSAGIFFDFQRGIIRMSSSEPSDERDFGPILAEFPRARAVKLTSALLHGTPAVAMLLDNGRNIVIRVDPENVELALEEMAKTYTVTPENIERRYVFPEKYRLKAKKPVNAAPITEPTQSPPSAG